MLKTVIAILASLFMAWVLTVWAPSLSHHVITALGINFTWTTLLFMLFLVATNRIVHGKK